MRDRTEEAMDEQQTVVPNHKNTRCFAVMYMAARGDDDAARECGASVRQVEVSQALQCPFALSVC